MSCPLCARYEAVLLELQAGLDRILGRHPFEEAIRVIRPSPEYDDRARELPIETLSE